MKIKGAWPAWAVLFKLLFFGIVPSAADCAEDPLQAKLARLLQKSCLACHSAGTKTPLDLSQLGYNLSDPTTFHTWERVFTRVQNGEMPPKGAPRPDAAVAAKALGALKLSLVKADLQTRGGERTPLRRLTRLEYGYTVQDLLHIDEAQGVELAEMLPAEADSGGFDTVAAHQGISPIHVKSYLTAADRALDMALALGPRPETRTFKIDYPESKAVVYFRNPKVNGGGFNMKLDGGEAIFFDFLASYITHSQMNGFRVPYPGRYRVTVDACAYRPARPNKPLALTLYKGIVPPGATAVLSELLGSVDLDGDKPKTLEATTYLRPGEAVAPNVANFANQYAALAYVGHINDYKGEGMALRTMTIEGPLLDQWPPASTRLLLKGVEFDDAGQVRLTKAPYAHVLEIVEAFATRAFRRPLAAGEAEQYASLAKPQLAAGRPFLEALREPLRAILVAPAFVYQAGPPGALDAYSLASRLSYFLWRGPPDTKLLDVARSGRLRDSAVLAGQVERMLNDAKSERFVDDFAAQAFRLRDLRRTTPDKGLYPDYDDRLGQAMRRETEMFLGELVTKDMGVRNLIDSDFTFVNRRLAEHYGIADATGVTGTEMRKVTLPPGSHRGGLLTQASILKLTSNGTTTSPVPRGNFVLTCLLGQPTPPPPPGVGTIEPDTRGATTIRDQLNAHRNSPVCGGCHRRIDPPGFALESFDPIGGFRTCYRKSGGTTTYGKYPVALPYAQGPAVDPSGVTPAGDSFQGIDEYKRLLVEKNLDQVARHFISALLVYSTGAEIEFADRDAVEQILNKTRDRGYPVRAIIHEVVASDLFRRR